MKTPEFEIVQVGKPQTAEEKRFARRLEPPSRDAQHLLDAAREVGWIYFIETGYTAVKIGWSTNVKKRFMAHKVSNHGTLRLIGMVPGCKQVERQFHEAFADHAMRGEWFRRSGVLGRIMPFLMDQGLRPFCTDSRNSPEVPSLYMFSGTFTGAYEI